MYVAARSLYRSPGVSGLRRPISVGRPRGIASLATMRPASSPGVMLPVPLMLIRPRYRSRGVGAVSLLAPVDGLISSLFGARAAPVAGASTNHQGIDYAVPVGTPVSAAAGGTIIFAGQQSGYGNTIIVDDGNGVQTLYGHLSSIGVSPGQSVSVGDTLGASGATGTVSGPNLHFGVMVDGSFVDPMPYLTGAPPVQNAVPTYDDSSPDVSTTSSDGFTLPDLSGVFGDFNLTDNSAAVAIAAGVAGLLLWMVVR